MFYYNFMKRIFFLVSFLLGLIFVSGGSVQAQTSCFDGSSWVGPSGNPPSSNRTKPLYASCSGTQVLGGDTFLVQFGEDSSTLYGNTASGYNIRIQDTANNPEIQLQYGTGSNDHWAIYNNQSDDSLRIWSYNSGSADDRLTILQNGNVGVNETSPSNKLDVNGIIETSGPNGTGAEGGLFIRNQLAGNALTGGLRIGGITTEQKYADIYWADGTNFYWAVNSGGVRNLHFRNNNAGIGLYFGNPTYSSTNQSVFYSDVDINGSIKIADGTQTDGYVLVSDANGLASWKPVSAASGAYSGYWQLSGSLLYPNSTNYDVGIGTTAPSAKLEVDGATKIIHSSSPSLYIQNDANSSSVYALEVYSQGLQKSYLSSNGGAYFSSDVGIGTTNPAVKLNVADNAVASTVAVSVDNLYESGAGGSQAETSALNLRLSKGGSGNGPKIAGQIIAGKDGGEWYTSDTVDSYMAFNLRRDNSKFEAMRITSDGFVGIATTTPAYTLDVDGDMRASNYYGASDRRLKKNIKPLGSVLAGLEELQPVSFEWKNDELSGVNIGLIAQDVEGVFPELVVTDKTGYKAIAYDQVSILLLAGFQEQQNKINELESRIDKLEKALNKLTNE